MFLRRLEGIDKGVLQAVAELRGPFGSLQQEIQASLRIREQLGLLDWSALKEAAVAAQRQYSSTVAALGPWHQMVADFRGAGGTRGLTGLLDARMQLPAIDPAIWSSFIDTLTSLSRGLEDVWRQLPSAEDVRRFHDELRADAETLGAAGWTWPRDMRSVDVRTLLLMGKRRSGVVNVDRWLIRHHELRMDELARMRYSPRLVRWRRQLKDCLRAYRRGWYGLVVPEALAVFEGVVSDFARLGEKVLRANTLATCVAAIEKDATDFDVTFWYSAAAFAKCIWARVSFDEDEPKQLNRNWINHGRSRRQIGRADALRLLTGILFVADLIEDLESPVAGAA